MQQFIYYYKQLYLFRASICPSSGVLGFILIILLHTMSSTRCCGWGSEEPVCSLVHWCKFCIRIRCTDTHTSYLYILPTNIQWSLIYRKRRDSQSKSLTMDHTRRQLFLWPRRLSHAQHCLGYEDQSCLEFINVKCKISVMYARCLPKSECVCRFS